MTEIITALITGVLALIGAAMPGISAARRTDAQIRASMAVTDTKLEELTREVRAHNGFAQRIPVLEEQIKVANHRIQDLENQTK